MQIGDVFFFRGRPSCVNYNELILDRRLQRRRRRHQWRDSIALTVCDVTRTARARRDDTTGRHACVITTATERQHNTPATAAAVGGGSGGSLFVLSVVQTSSLTGLPDTRLQFHDSQTRIVLYAAQCQCQLYIYIAQNHYSISTVSSVLSNG